MSYGPESVQVYATDRISQKTFIQVSFAGRDTLRLLLDEAEQYALTILRAVNDVRGGPALPEDDGTVLDPDNNLSVAVDHADPDSDDSGTVVLFADMAEDGEYHLDPHEARALATALLHHAARAEVRR